MKPNIVVATQSERFLTSVKTELAGLCTVTSSGTQKELSETLFTGNCRALLLDARMRSLEPVDLLHTLHHCRESNFFVMSAGPMDPAIILGARDSVQWFPMPASSARTICNALRALLDPASSRSIDKVSYQPAEKAYFIVFRNGKNYELSRSVIEADDGKEITSGPDVIHDGEAFRVGQESGNTYEVAWDFVLYHQEPDYSYYKGKPRQKEMEARRAERIGKRVRRERESRGWSLGEFGRRTAMYPPNLSRLESGKHVPALETLERVADALGLRVVDLLGA